MKQLLIKTLSPFGYPVVLQGTIPPEESYPNTFLTFWTDSTDDNTHYDNDTHSVRWSFSLILYSADPEVVNTKPNEIIPALKTVGFIPQGKGRDIPSDDPAYTGWAMDFVYIENL